MDMMEMMDDQDGRDLSSFFASLLLCWTVWLSGSVPLLLAMGPSGERLQCGAESSGSSVCCGYGSVCIATVEPYGLDELAGRMNDLSVMVSLVPHLPHHVLPRPMSHLPRPMFVPVPTTHVHVCWVRY